MRHAEFEESEDMLPILTWQNPEVPFEGTLEEVEQYTRSGDWVMVFNALALPYRILCTETVPASPLGMEFPPFDPADGIEPAATKERF